MTMKYDPEKIKERVRVLKKGKLKNKSLLDIGAGPLALIAARDFNCHVTTIDIDEDALKEAKKEASKEGLADKVSFEKEDATNLSYTNNSFDVVVSYCALHHVNLNKRKRFIQEMYRVAREKVIIAEFNKLGFEQRHSQDDYTSVNLNWLEKELSSLGKIKKYPSKKVDIYICFK